jgi:hypothetical protein
MTFTVSCYGKDGDPSKPGLTKPFTYSEWVDSELIATNRFPELVPNLIKAWFPTKVERVESVEVSLKGSTVGIVEAPILIDGQTQYIWVVVVKNQRESMGESVDVIKDLGALTVTITTSGPSTIGSVTVTVEVVDP